MDFCMLCYEDNNIFFCCKCLLDIYEYSICNKQLKLLEVIQQLQHVTHNI